jgi:DNA (cytosine-5)-methyltransferase 1
MGEIAALPWNGMTVASTFSGCGGSSLGYRMAGFRVLYANEFVAAARDTYAANAAPYTVLDPRDIRTLQPADVLAALQLPAGELDVLDGSPPCASFSTAGKRQKDWGKVKTYSETAQRTDDLFFEFARILRGVQPRVFIAENVSGLVKGVAKGYFLDILAELKGCGYRVACKLLDAQWLGVPQARQRTIFVGVRNDLEREPVHPTPLRYRYTIRDALPWIERVVHDTSGLYGAGDVTHRPSPAITVGVHSVNSLHFKVEGPPQNIIAVGANDGYGKETWQSTDLPAKTIGASPNTGNGRVGFGDVLVRAVEAEATHQTDISRYAIGAEWDKLKPGEQSARYFSLVRCAPDRPAPTVQQRHGCVSVAGITHPTERRKFTIAELRRLCGFPDDFVLTGTYAQQWERLGRAVPPVMMAAIAAAVRDHVLLPLRAEGR